jgi:hypothetical protein
VQAYITERKRAPYTLRSPPHAEEQARDSNGVHAQDDRPRPRILRGTRAPSRTFSGIGRRARVAETTTARGPDRPDLDLGRPVATHHIDTVLSSRTRLAASNDQEPDERRRGARASRRDWPCRRWGAPRSSPLPWQAEGMEQLFVRDHLEFAVCQNGRYLQAWNFEDFLFKIFLN